MIHSLEIQDLDLVPFGYINKLLEKNKNFPRSFEFIDGINIIVGKNGSGKSTILNLIKHFSLCKESFYSNFSEIEGVTFLSYLKDSVGIGVDPKLYDGVKITADYEKVVFNLRTFEKMNKHTCSLTDIDQMWYSSNKSNGEKHLLALSMLYEKMFSKETDLRFPISSILDTIELSNVFYKNCYRQLLSYYKENNKDSDSFTVLMDEPDQNLDIENIKSILEVLSFQKENTQVIAVIHNPILIYKLRKFDYINWIELTENYIEDIINFIES